MARDLLSWTGMRTSLLFGSFILFALAGCPPIEEEPGDDTDAAAEADAGFETDAGIDPDAATDPDATAPPAELGEVVETTGGSLRGEADGDLVVFRGVPYAAPPVGELRFTPPEPHEGWSGMRHAIAFGHECPQRDGDAVKGDEDCLTLNVWAPAEPGPRPVMLFIHGGAFVNGSGVRELYDGANLSRAGDVVVVTINYRLGALGFLTRESLAGSDGALGNYGIRDQIAALTWVRDNIAAFHGDPDAVTIFGESAGAGSICALLGAEAADGLYAGAIMQSGGGCGGYQDPREGATPMIARHASITEGVGCAAGEGEAACLRAADADAFVLAQRSDAVDLAADIGSAVEFAPAIDSVFLHEQPIDRVRSGEAPDVPIMIGSNADEAFIFTLDRAFMTWRGYDRLVRQIYPAQADALLALYSADTFDRPRAALDALVGDLLFVCPTLSFGNAVPTGNPVFVYHYTHVLAGLLGAGGAVHGVELLFVFDQFPGWYAERPEDRALVETMQGAWTSFAHDGVPALPETWPSYDPSAETIPLLTTPVALTDELVGGRCAALEDLGILP